MGNHLPFSPELSSLRADHFARRAPCGIQWSLGEAPTRPPTFFKGLLIQALPGSVGGSVGGLDGNKPTWVGRWLHCRAEGAAPRVP